MALIAVFVVYHAIPHGVVKGLGDDVAVSESYRFIALFAKPLLVSA